MRIFKDRLFNKWAYKDVAPPLNVILNVCGLVPQTDPLTGVILADAGLLQPQLLTVTPTLSVSVQPLALVTVTV